MKKWELEMQIENMRDVLADAVFAGNDADIAFYEACVADAERELANLDGLTDEECPLVYSC